MAQIVTYARPSRLYRYRALSAENINRELRAIEEKYIYCADYKSMNDPMEGGHRLSSAFASSRARGEIKNNYTHLMREMGIASLSETRTHEAMWAHYAGSFSGVCISYSTRKLLSGLPHEVDLVKMNYSNEPPVMLRSSVTVPQRAKLALSYKTLRWESEREWRIFKMPPNGQQHYEGTKTVTAIYVGLRAEKDIVDEVVARADYLAIPVYQMTVKKYDLRFKKIKTS